MRRGVPEWSHVRLQTTPSSCRSASQQQHFCGDVWSAECHNSTENTSVEELNIWPQYSPKRKELNWHHLGVRPPCLPLVAAGHWVVFGLPLRMECCYTERRWEEETRGVIRQTMQDLHCTFMVEREREESEHVSSNIAGKPWTKSIHVSTSDDAVLMMPRLAAKMKSGTTTAAIILILLIIIQMHFFYC